MPTFDYTYAKPANLSEYPTVGGGDYSGKVSKSKLDNPDFVVDSVSDFTNLNSHVTDNHFVRVDIDIDLTGEPQVVIDTSGITIAGDRGHSGSEGPYIYTTNSGEDLIKLNGGGQTVTGLNFTGVDDTHTSAGAGEGIRVQSKNCEIYNCRLRGFGEAAIQLGSSNSQNLGTLQCHHLETVDCPRQELGYGIAIYHGHGEIWRWYSDFCRHKVTSDGSTDSSYEIYDSYIAGHAIYAGVDIHENGGEYFDIHHNDIEAHTDVRDDGKASSIVFRGDPEKISPIKHNAFGDPEGTHDWDDAIEWNTTESSYPGNLDVASNDYNLSDTTSSAEGIRAGPIVETDSVSGIGEDEATLNGTLNSLGGAATADCYFEYRWIEATTWTATSIQTFSLSQSYSQTVSGLSTGTDYEFRAVADASDGDNDTGLIVSFTTQGARSDLSVEPQFGTLQLGEGRIGTAPTDASVIPQLGTLSLGQGQFGDRGSPPLGSKQLGEVRIG